MTERPPSYDAADRGQRLRAFYARHVAAKGRTEDPRIIAAFERVPRERFLGPPPWMMFGGDGYLQTPDGDLAYVYRDELIGLVPERGINNGQPSLHAANLGALRVQPGETVIHVGAGLGYYSAILAELVGPKGRVEAFEIDPDLAEQARVNLAPWPQARVEAKSAVEPPLPQAEVIYVNAGATDVPRPWLDALKPAGRLLFPLTPPRGVGGMLLVTRTKDGFAARVLGPAGFIPCIGAQSEAVAARIGEAFGFSALPRWIAVKSLRLGAPPDATCWLEGEGWWLSTEAAA